MRDIFGFFIVQHLDAIAIPDLRPTTIGRETLREIHRRVSPIGVRHTLPNIAPCLPHLEARVIRPMCLPRLEARVIRPLRPAKPSPPRTLTPPAFPGQAPAPLKKLYVLRMTCVGFALGAVLALIAYLGTSANVLSSL